MKVCSNSSFFNILVTAYKIQLVIFRVVGVIAYQRYQLVTDMLLVSTVYHMGSEIALLMNPNTEMSYRLPTVH